MRQFQIYGVSSVLIVTVVIIGLIIYVVTNNILFLLLVYLLAFLAFVFLVSLTPKFFYGQISGSSEMKDTVLSSRKNEIAGLICRDCKGTRALMERVSSEVDITGANTELERLGQELASMKCCSSSFEIMPDELGSVDLTFLTTRSAEVRDRLSAIKRSLASKYSSLSEKKSGEMDLAMKSLLSSGYGIKDLYAKFEGTLKRSPQTLDEMVEKEEELVSIMKDSLILCIEEAKRIAGDESRRKGASEVSYAIGKINLTEGELEATASELASIRKKLQSLMGGDFAITRQALVSSIQAAANASAGAGLSKLKGEFSKLLEETKSMDDPSKLSKLREIEKDYRELAKKSLNELSAKTDGLKEELDSYKPPREMQTKLPDKSSTPSGTLPEFTKRLAATLKELSPGLDELIRNVRIMRSYQKIEKLIDARISENGKVQAKDIDINYPEVFFLLYKKKHPKVKFIESPEPKLIEN
ncbi:MAG: hypothetical protein ABIF01_00310 [Candidatus Micrarchaeota archaeon]